MQDHGKHLSVFNSTCGSQMYKSAIVGVSKLFADAGIPLADARVRLKDAKHSLDFRYFNVYDIVFTEDWPSHEASRSRLTLFMSTMNRSG